MYEEIKKLNKETKKIVKKTFDSALMNSGIGGYFSMSPEEYGLAKEAFGVMKLYMETVEAMAKEADENNRQVQDKLDKIIGGIDFIQDIITSDDTKHLKEYLKNKYKEEDE